MIYIYIVHLIYVILLIHRELLFGLIHSRENLKLKVNVHENESVKDIFFKSNRRKSFHIRAYARSRNCELVLEKEKGKSVYVYSA